MISFHHYPRSPYPLGMGMGPFSLCTATSQPEAQQKKEPINRSTPNRQGGQRSKPGNQPGGCL